MSKFFLSLHVVAAVLAVGPVTVASSLFPPRMRAVLAGNTARMPEVRLLHRVTRTYAWVGIAVPVLGVATAVSMGVLNDAWVMVSLVLTALAAGLLMARILPGQAEALATADGETGAEDRATAEASTRSLAMMTGVFSLLWTVVLVLMIIRPGSTTGA
ncbi:hypothetical protein ACFWRV_06880 [Streptomyces sp. NPDC058576]|uniref:hypothetical protein n=1 Tax=Streptomyces sp. NPDC058576 TaxID=3346547 RepID=UPI003646AEBA